MKKPRKQIGRWIIAVVVVALAAGAAWNAHVRGRRKVPVVQIEPVTRHDLVASVTAMGQLEPHTKVDVIADVSGRVVRLAVREGDYVRKGQFLLEIDPSQPRAAAERAAAGVATARSSAAQARTNLALAERQYQRTAQLKQENPALVAEDEVDKLRTQVQLDSSLLESALHAVDEAAGALREAESALAKTTIVAPMSGQVTRLNVAEGETAITGTFSRDAATLLTISDMRELETKVMVPEGDVSRLEVGDSVAVAIEAIPDSIFPGRVASISNSSARDASGGAGGAGAGTGGAAGGARVVNYEVTVQLLRIPPHTRPDFSATATIVAATRHQVIAVPIIALAIRDRPVVGAPRTDSAPAAYVVPVIAHGDPPAPRAPGTRDSGAHDAGRHDVEGVFVVGVGDTVHFRPVTVGVTGERFVEVLAGLTPGDRIVTGPYETIRDLTDGAAVHAQ